MEVEIRLIPEFRKALIHENRRNYGKAIGCSHQTLRQDRMRDVRKTTSRRDGDSTRMALPAPTTRALGTVTSVDMMLLTSSQEGGQQALDRILTFFTTSR